MIAVIRQCPSGALSYTLDGVEHRGQDREPAVRLAKDGPYHVEGGVTLEDVAQGDGASKDHVALCRCGSSTNKPFCDGTHWSVHFTGDNSVRVADLGELEERTPTRAEVEGVELVVTRVGSNVSVLEGTCRHQGGVMSDSALEGDDLVCGLHGWAYNAGTGLNKDGSGQDLKLFRSWIDRDVVFIDADEVIAWKMARADAPTSDSASARTEGTPEEPHNAYIHHLAQQGLSKDRRARPDNVDGCPTLRAADRRLHHSGRPRAHRLNRFLRAATALMCVMARACGHTHLNQFALDDLTTWKRDVAYLTGVTYGGVVPL